MTKGRTNWDGLGGFYEGQWACQLQVIGM